MGLFNQSNIILLTGIKGQLGQALCRYIYSKNENNLIIGTTTNASCDVVKGLKDKYPKIIITEGDPANKAFIESLVCSFRPNVIGHLHAQSSVATSLTQPSLTYNNNIFPVLNLIDICNDKDITLFNMSSVEIFGNYYCPIIDGRNEETPLSPTNSYGASKAAGHTIIKTERISRKKKYYNFICNNFISEFQNINFVAAKIIDFAVNNIDTSNVLELGNVESIRDWMYVDDVCSAIDIALNNEASDYCIAGGNIHTVREFVDIVFEQCKINKSRISICNKLIRVGDTTFSTTFTTKLKNIGWKPKYDIHSLVQKIILEKKNGKK